MISIDRIRSSCDRFGSKFLSRFLSSSEIQLCHNQDQPNFQRIAGFWASKEAISKALGVGIGGDLGFLDICLSKDSKGRPQACLISSKSDLFGIESIHLSITHDQNLAIATALIVQKSSKIQAHILKEGKL